MGCAGSKGMPASGLVKVLSAFYIHFQTRRLRSNAERVVYAQRLRREQICVLWAARQSTLGPQPRRA